MTSGVGHNILHTAVSRSLVEKATTDSGSRLHLLFKASEEATEGLIHLCTDNDSTPATRPVRSVGWAATAPTPRPPPVWVTFREETGTRLKSPSASVGGSVKPSDANRDGD
ncbi:MAG: hypothetical protein KatS3mg077_0097 [Candidatus Binatia bacterium]|nr:MAG: hypothetical protein KatS3mg077_0097 [Candidatus Binatia bacterium]